jgi:hypothetical protein
MNKNIVLKIVNLILGIMLLNQVLTGVFGHQLPSGAFEVLHKHAGIIFTIVVVFHIILNWNWINASYFRKPSKTKTQPAYR